MVSQPRLSVPRWIKSWTTTVPVLAVVVLALTWGRFLPTPVVVVVALVLAAAVLAAVHHAEMVAARVGEPLGSLVLAIAVTVIEVGLIVTLMVSGKGDTSTLARDTVFAAVMITCNGILGLVLLVGAVRQGLATSTRRERGRRSRPSPRSRCSAWSCRRSRPPSRARSTRGRN